MIITAVVDAIYREFSELGNLFTTSVWSRELAVTIAILAGACGTPYLARSLDLTDGQILALGLIGILLACSRVARGIKPDRLRKAEEAVLHYQAGLQREICSQESLRQELYHARDQADRLLQELNDVKREAEEYAPERLKQLFRDHAALVDEMLQMLAAPGRAFLRVVEGAAHTIAGGEEVLERMQKLARELDVALGDTAGSTGGLEAMCPEDPHEFFGTSDSDEIKDRYWALAKPFHPDCAVNYGGMEWIHEFLTEFFRIVNARKEACS